MTALRIGMVCHPGMGGSGAVAAELAVGLAQRGHRVHVVASRTPFRLRPDRQGVRVHQVSANAHPSLESIPHTLALASRISQLIDEESLDVLHVHYAVPYGVAAYLAQQAASRHVPVVLSLHGTDVTHLGHDPAYMPMVKLAIAQAAALTAPSEYLAGLIDKAFAANAQASVAVIANFVDATKFTPARDNRPDRPFVIVHSSNFRPIKRVADVVQAFARVRQQVPATLRLVGDGPERQRVEAQVMELGLSNDVRFEGAVHDVSSVLQKGDAFLLPSESESFGLSALEAMSCGLPVVASKAGGLVELVSHNKTGYLVPVGDVQGMTDHLVHLAHNPEMARAMGTAARQFAIQHAAADVALQRYEQVYADVLAVKRKAG